MADKQRQLKTVVMNYCMTTAVVYRRSGLLPVTRPVVRRKRNIIRIKDKFKSMTLVSVGAMLQN